MQEIESGAGTPAWPADRVERRAVAALVPYAKNARTHSEAQVAQLAAAIREWGWTTPVLVDEASNIIAGHGRVLAAQQLGLAEVPVMVAAGWSEAQKRAYVIADNKLAENAGWDEQLLRVELGDLQSVGFTLGLTGFGAGELKELFSPGNAGLCDPDLAPPLPATPVSALGDLWILGAHRLVCGDSTNAAAVAQLLDGAVPHLMVTDPPYGVEYDPLWRAGPGRRVRQTGKVLNDDRADWSEAWRLFPGDVAYVWHAGSFSAVVDDSLRTGGFGIRAQIIWVKDRFAISRGHYHFRHEACFYAVRKGKTARWQGGRKQQTVWEVRGLSGPLVEAVCRQLDESGAETTVWSIAMTVDDGASGHGTQKPVECMRRPMLNNSVRGDSVYDPFLGSGTALIAAEMEGRRCFGLELDPGYCDVIVQRWENFTGKKAERHVGTERPG